MKNLDDGEGVHEALVFAEQLVYRADSHYSAMVSGGMQFLGWDDHAVIAADTADVLIAILWGLGGKVPTEADRVQRPKVEKPAEAATIADFNPGAFLRWLMS